MTTEKLESVKNWVQKTKRHGTEADRYLMGPSRPELIRPSTIQEAITALAENTYPTSHLTCPKEMSKTNLLNLTEALHTNKSLTSIDLAGNELDRDIQEALLDAVSANKNIMSITGMNALSFIDCSEHRTLDTNITAILAKNEDYTTALASHMLNLRTLFDKPCEEIEPITDAINEHQAAVYRTLEEFADAGKVNLGDKGAEQLFHLAKGWASARYMHSAELDIPTKPLEQLDNLVQDAEITHLTPRTQVNETSYERNKLENSGDYIMGNKAKQNTRT